MKLRAFEGPGSVFESSSHVLRIFRPRKSTIRERMVPQVPKDNELFEGDQVFRSLNVLAFHSLRKAQVPTEYLDSDTTIFMLFSRLAPPRNSTKKYI